MSKSFGDRPALIEASLEVAWGEVHALLGENGAGKSTLMNVLSGFYAADEGRLEYDGASRQFPTPISAIDCGIGMVHQHFKLVGTLSALDNLRLACGRRAAWRSTAEATEAISGLADELGFAVNLLVPVADLPVAVQQRVEILKVLLMGARLIVLDEPTAVLTDQEATEMLQLVRSLARSGRAVILITHKMRDVSGFADRITVMRGGRTVLDKAPSNTPHPVLVLAMMGDAEVKVAARGEAQVGAPLLRLQEVSVDGGPHGVALRDCSLTVRAGEILGLAGVGGNGQSELVQTILGLLRPESGVVEIAAQAVPADFSRRRALGLRFIPDDRFRLGLFGGLSVMENLMMPRLARGQRRHRSDRTEVQETIRANKIAGAAPDTPARLLSGGNAQKLMIAREFDTGLEVLIAHSPTRGLDVAAIAHIRRQLIVATERGAAILLVSEDLDEVLQLSDRVSVMSHGRILPPTPVHQVDRAHIGRQIMGIVG
ncbi:ABC transporter ATP-binding protein [Antarctobacter sp.]|uniref:ABC transporter ATP-binding protein n=1 Tax=Antarctobacter sp. TaxID=1872577 RepID=UPI002B27A25A|nr:ATP-binding cassette domain-containing protein [Antarctobacter sp.]